MRTVQVGEITTAEGAARIARMVREHPQTVEAVLRRHGAIIEARAATITPVDTGLLRRANKARVAPTSGATVGAIALVVENRMVYAAYQHNYKHRHSQPTARDHFIQIPFEAEVPAIAADIIDKDMEALQ